MDRLSVAKTYKLYVGGAFPRSESGRSLPVEGPKGEPIAHIAHASRKDLRDAVEAARAAQPKWANATPYNRGQVMYRMAEMMEGKRDELARAVEAMRNGAKGKKAGGGAEVTRAIDRLVHYAGWCDKYAQVLGCNNPVAGPFYNFTAPEATGVVCAVCPDQAPLLGLVSLLAPALVPGNAVVAVAGDDAGIAAAVFGEVCATSDVPAGVINVLTGKRAELIQHIAGHRDIDAVHGANLDADTSRRLRDGAAENLKRVKVRDNTDFSDDDVWNSPWRIEPFVEFKTMWHPALS
ncbi:MAG TPA: aldehyde dehydrogenase family protein [Phycisphaerales bacterium]|nr:aldehyde dehydrogenase family protein [Phycisphaerales bacterium]